MMFLSSLLLLLLPFTTAVPSKHEERQSSPTVELSHATVIGSSASGVDTFNGIPYALPPTGQLRLKPPQPINSSLGTLTLPSSAKACPQFVSQIDSSNLVSDLLGTLANSFLFQDILLNESEDCLTIDVQRPSTATPDSKLPVVFWIYGGGFELGWTSMYSGSDLVQDSIALEQDVIFVAVNYRIGGFGFLAGKEILEDGSANIGLLDQRMGLEWVADNIAKFGGDPDKVTIWGESAGSLSVFDQMALFDGNNTYKGKPLFRAAIMNSGTVLPAERIDHPRAQAIYDTVVSKAGCSSSNDTLSCLRSLDYTTYLNAVTSVPNMLSYNGLALSYLPRPDGTILTDSPEILAKAGKFTAVPFIVGDQEDEGTLFSFFQSNLTTPEDVTEYVSTVFFPDAGAGVVEGLTSLYPDDPAAGSPFRTGTANQVYPQYKRLAAILGDFTFTLTRRYFIRDAIAAHPNVSIWSYLASYNYGTPILGTTHGSDLTPNFGMQSDAQTKAIEKELHGYWIPFINDLDPNVNGSGAWPKWTDGDVPMLAWFLVNDTAALLPDTFRDEAAVFLGDATLRM